MTANVAVHYALLLTLAVLLEAPVYLILLRGRFPARRLLLVALVVNLITNPLANFVYLTWDVEIWALEVGVILAEAALLLAFLRCSMARAAALSLVANLTSWLLGVPLYTTIMGLIGRAVT